MHERSNEKSGARLKTESETGERLSFASHVHGSTGSPSSKYEHRRASALLSNIQNIRIRMGKKPIVSLTYENEMISIKNSLPYLKCVYYVSPVWSTGRFMGFYLNGFLRGLVHSLLGRT